MKKILFLLIALLMLWTCAGLKAQSYPCWDIYNPYPLYYINSEYNPYNIQYTYASTNGVFCIANAAPDFSDNVIQRWTPCGGWEQLNGLTYVTDSQFYSQVGSAPWMTIHDHYLYVVGNLYLDGYTNNPVAVARFDFNTGLWSPVAQGPSFFDNRTPFTIAIDTAGRIYVGYFVYSPVDDYGFYTDYSGMTLSNLLEVSADGGTSWNPVGDGFVVESRPDSDAGVWPVITTLCADGTNVYIAGDFTGAAGQPAGSSKHVIMWTGNGWRNLGGVDCVSTESFTADEGDVAFDLGSILSGYNHDMNIVSSIASVGTNIYVTGVFDQPQVGIARFSNVTGQSLPIDGLLPPVDDVGLTYAAGYAWGSSLAVNSNQLYIAGHFISPNNIASNYACLSDPTASNPSQWETVLPDLIYPDFFTESGPPNDSYFGREVSSAPDGNAVYCLGISQFNRWMLASDGPSPSAQITNVTATTLFITGTPQSRWQVLYSFDQVSWTLFDSITLWSGAGTVDVSAFNPFPQYWKLTDNCGESQVYTNSTIINVQFLGSDVQTPKIGPAAVGFVNDNWNTLAALDGTESPIGDPGSTTYGFIECSDNLENTTPITVSLLSEGDPLFGFSCGSGSGTVAAATDSLMQGIETEDSGSSLDIIIGGLDPHAAYDIYVYGLAQLGLGTLRAASQFEFLTNSAIDVAIDSFNPQSTDTGLGWDINNWQEGKQYVVFRNVHFTSPTRGISRAITIQISHSNWETVINGLQILRR